MTAARRTANPCQTFSNPWETALADWQRQHPALTTRLIAIETDIDDRVCRLFNLTPADRRLLADHSRHAMIDYPFGAV